MESQKITFLIGVAGSGKSTFCRKYVAGHPNTVVVGRDLLRKSLLGLDDYGLAEYFDTIDFTIENLITEMQTAMIATAIKNKKSVLIDNTNLRQKYINAIRKSFPTAEFAYELFDLSLDELLERNGKRVVYPHSNAEKTGGRQMVSDDVVRDQFKQFGEIKQWLRTKWTSSKIAKTPETLLLQNPELPDAFVFDLDGTLAHATKRNIFDASRADEDEVDSAVSILYHILQSRGYPIIVCTGRQGEFREATQRWMDKMGFRYTELHMRPIGDKRADYHIKEEMWRDIAKRYNMVALIDDRNQVVNHARALGLKVFQVADGDF